jgi:uncharacterized protein YcbK (DUF882 family)
MNKEYFTKKEMECQHCGKSKWDQEFIDWLTLVRIEADFPFPITSGYRCSEHPLEARKSIPTSGAHTTGRAVDIGVRGAKALRVVEIALKHGCVRVGVNQKGRNRFVHLDLADKPSSLWSY